MKDQNKLLSPEEGVSFFTGFEGGEDEESCFPPSAGEGSVAGSVDVPEKKIAWKEAGVLGKGGEGLGGREKVFILAVLEDPAALLSGGIGEFAGKEKRQGA